MRNEAFSAARKRLGMKQVEIAQVLDLSPTTIGHYEHGRRPVPRYIKLAMMALWHRLEDPL